MMNPDLRWVVFRFLRFVPCLEWRYALRRAVLLRIYRRDIHRLEKAGDQCKTEDMNFELNTELDLLDDNRDLEVTTMLRTKAVRLSVAIPDISYSDLDGSETWKRCNSNGYLCLTTTGIETIRTAIRQEQSARHKILAHWLNWFTAGASMIAAIASVMALIK